MVSTVCLTTISRNEGSLASIMIHVDDRDIQALAAGQPPVHRDLLSTMTLGDPQWRTYVQEHYLSNYIADGGSKVKVLTGQAGSGKTHHLHYLLNQAQALGYATIYFSARDIRLNNLVSLYKAIVDQFDLEALCHGLCRQITRKLGYEDPEFDDFLSQLMADQAMTRDLAIQDIKKAVGDHLRDVDLGPSFLAFVHKIINGYLLESNRLEVHLAQTWLTGAKLDRQQKQLTRLFERLQKSNARYWLYSLTRLLKLCGYTGLVIAIDDLEVMTERSTEKRRYKYSASAVRDVCELVRQIIDDVELLDHCLWLLAGRRDILDNERRGFKSYEALWMRLQTGLAPTNQFNPLADIVDIDRYLDAQGPAFPAQVAGHLTALLRDAPPDLTALPTVETPLTPEDPDFSALRASVIQTIQALPSRS